MGYDLPNEETQNGSNTPSNPCPWATVAEAALHFRRSEWFIRKTANKMSKHSVARHPIKAGRDWLIDIDGMTAFFSAEAERSSSETCYPITEIDASLPGQTEPDETWEWGSGVA